jgi:hypothetical protein
MAQRLPFDPPFRPEEFQSTAMGRSLLAGKLVATAVSNIDGRHITVRLSPKRPPRDNERRWQACPLTEAVRCFVDVPGPDLSLGDQVGTFQVEGSVFWATNSDSRRVNAARYVLLCAAGRLDGAKVLMSTNCFFCGRPLTDPVSIRRGIGPVCFGKLPGSEHERKGTDDFAPQTLAAANHERLAAMTPPEPTPEPTPEPVADDGQTFLILTPGTDPRSLL